MFNGVSFCLVLVYYRLSSDSSKANRLTCTWRHSFIILDSLSSLELFDSFRCDLHIAVEERSVLPFVPCSFLRLRNNNSHVCGRDFLVEFPLLQFFLPLSFTKIEISTRGIDQKQFPTSL